MMKGTGSHEKLHFMALAKKTVAIYEYDRVHILLSVVASGHVTQVG